MFYHKRIHVYTQEEPRRNEKSVIDYIVGSDRIFKTVRDVRVKRGPEIGSDHYILFTIKNLEMKQSVLNHEKWKPSQRPEHTNCEIKVTGMVLAKGLKKVLLHLGL